jgi:group I intron endonuclease
MLIYKIVNKVNGKIYIGQTIRSLKERFADHCKNKRSTTILHKAIQKYGKDNFTIEQLDFANSREELNCLEQYWISMNNCISPNGYNLCLGGNAAGKQSEELRRKRSEFYDKNPEKRKLIGEISKQNWKDPNYRDKVLLAIKKTMSTPEYRKQCSERMKLRHKNRREKTL